MSTHNIFSRKNKKTIYWISPFILFEHEMFSAVILSPLLIQKGYLSVSRMCTSTG